MFTDRVISIYASNDVAQVLVAIMPKMRTTRKYSARAQFKINTHRCWNWHLCIPDELSVVQCSLGHVIGVAFLDAISVAWSERAGQLAAGGVASIWSSIPAGSTIIYRFLCGFIFVFLWQSIKIKPTNIYIFIIYIMHWKQFPDSKYHGANMGPTWVMSVLDGPHVGPMNLAIRVSFKLTCHTKYALIQRIMAIVDKAIALRYQLS